MEGRLRCGVDGGIGRGFCCEVVRKRVVRGRWLREVNLHFVGKNISAGSAHGIIGRDLNHDLVKVLNDVFETL